jgi:hypothetical protein
MKKEHGEESGSRKKVCPCLYTECERHGNCDACSAYHHGRGQKTSCEREASA